MSPGSHAWVAFIRGINLGRHKKVPMAELRVLLAGLGYGDVRTLLQSGNAVFTAGETEASALERSIETAIEAKFGHEVTAMVRDSDQLSAVVAGSPFADQTIDRKELHAAFLSAPPSAEKLSALEPAAYAPDEFAVGEGVIYLRMPNGFQASKLPDWERVLHVQTTVRTWNTVLKVVEVAGALRPR